MLSFKKLKPVFASTEFENNGPVYLFETKFRHLNFFLSSIATNGKDKYGLNFGKFRPPYFVILWADPHLQTNLEWYLNP